MLWRFHHEGLAAAAAVMSAVGGSGVDDDGVWRSWDAINAGRRRIALRDGSLEVVGPTGRGSTSWWPPGRRRGTFIAGDDLVAPSHLPRCGVDRGRVRASTPALGGRHAAERAAVELLDVRMAAPVPPVAVQLVLFDT